jgi:putative photosynthetic complex assembly protein 2
MPTAPWIAALVALFAWWASTGAILVAVRLADRRGIGGTAVAVAGLPILGLGLWALWASLGRADPGAAYLGFAAALAIWGWIELAFLTGALTGPNRYPCPPGVPEWERFLRAWGTIAYHELTLAAALICLGLVSYEIAGGIAGAWAFWTFAVLFFARVSAKLNLFFGVPYINTEFLPAALSHLASHFRQGSLNRMFPASVSVLALAAGCWLERLWSAQTETQIVGFALLAAMTVLALIEHWLMAVPLADAKLWRWMLPASGPEKTRPEGQDGF